MEEIKVMREVKVFLEDGNSFTTKINGTPEEIISYYKGRFWNLSADPEREEWKRCVDVVFLDSPMPKELELLDMLEEIRQKLHEKPTQYTADYAVRLCEATVASYLGYDSRTSWTKELKSCEESRYSKRMKEGAFYL